MKKNIFERKQEFILIISPLLSLISFILVYFIDPLKYGEHESLAAIPAFLLSIIILVIGQIITIHNEVEKVSVDSERVYETVKNYLHVTKMGTPQSAWRYIIDRLSILDYVHISFFIYADEFEESNERLYDNNDYQSSLKAIAKYVSQCLKWNDIGDHSASKRFRQIADAITDTSKGHYNYKFITQSEPQIGFTLLTYKDGTTEVLFNWDFRDIPQDPTVLLSRDIEIFTMFSAQYKGLWRVGANDYDNNATRSTS